MDFDPVGLYWAARRRGLQPALLESLGCRTSFGRRSLLAIGATRRLAARDGILYEDETPVGEAGDLFRRLEASVPRETAFFPVWVGFLAYEFAGRLGLPTGAPMPGLPEAAFSLYPDGWLWEDGRLVHAPAEPFPPERPPAPVLPPVVPTSDYPCEDFVAGIDEVQERIREGWVYQVNLSHRFRFPAAGVDPLACYQRLRTVNPSPFMGLLEGDGWAVVSGSPERLFSVGDGRLTARPIAGTRPRSGDPGEDERLEAELRASAKEQAEHVMLVDLLRNDLARVCEPGSVEVSEAFTVERYSHVMHLVSEVCGRLLTSHGTRGVDSDGPGKAADLHDVVAAIFPGGTITGAPKESVMREIARLEPVPRGAYTGSLGYVSGAGADFNILIRSLTFAGGQGHISAGGGIVIGSDATEEYLETRHKAEALLHVLGSGGGGHPCAPPVRLRTWRPPRPPRSCPAAVLFIEAHDSFSYNIVDYLRVLGASVRVVDFAMAPELRGVTHVVLGPGPGDPAGAGRMLDWVSATLAAGLPLLGVCLGHQALGVQLGARLVRAARPVHGESHEIRHTGTGLFAGLPNPAPFTRYHSLCLTDLPPDLPCCAWTNEGTVMALAHRDRPAWGVQFHPESMLSVHGMQLLANFLDSRRR